MLGTSYSIWTEISTVVFVKSLKVTSKEYWDLVPWTVITIMLPVLREKFTAHAVPVLKNQSLSVNFIITNAEVHKWLSKDVFFFLPSITGNKGACCTLRVTVALLLVSEKKTKRGSVMNIEWLKSHESTYNSVLTCFLHMTRHCFC